MTEQNTKQLPFENIQYDPKEPKQIEIKNEFIKVLKENCECEDYNQVIEYLFPNIFGSKQTRSEMIEEYQAMFESKTEELLDELISITNKVYFNHNTTKTSIRRSHSRSRSRSRDKEHKKENSNSHSQQYHYRGRPPIRRFMPARMNYMYPPPQFPRGGRPIFPYRSNNIYRGKRDYQSKSTTQKDEDINNNNNNSNNNNNTKPQQNETNPKEKNNTNTNDKQQQQQQTQPQNESKDDQSQIKKKTRCKNWPNCKDKQCEYSHPKEICPYFPGCDFGDKCMYIHPTVQCKYGFSCTRQGCNYSHPAGWIPALNAYPMHYRGGYGQKFMKKQYNTNSQQNEEGSNNTKGKNKKNEE